MAIAAKAATPQVRIRLRVCIFIFLLVWVALHCSTRLLYLSYTAALETPQNILKDDNAKQFCSAVRIASLGYQKSKGGGDDNPPAACFRNRFTFVSVF
jgi:hypothetical protein